MTKHPIIAKAMMEAKMKMSRLARPVRFTYLSILYLPKRAPLKQTKKKKTAYCHGTTPEVTKIMASEELVKTIIVAVVTVDT